jgi:hypothetical protein
MKKQEYLSPETTFIRLAIEHPVCQSGSIEGFDPIDTDFPMFSAIEFNSIL